jgi:RNA polymerase sigma factor (sigma-70 family)
MLPDMVVDGDGSLLRAWRSGDTTAGEALFDRHFASVRRFFRNKVPETDVEDLVQRTFEVLVSCAHQYRAEAPFVTYVLAIARSQLHRWLRKREPTREGIDLAEVSIHDLGVSPTAVVAARERQSMLLDALQRIPIELQTILELFYWEGLSGAEIATILEIEHGTVRSRLNRARTRLRDELIRLERSATTPWVALEQMDTEARTIAALLT